MSNEKDLAERLFQVKNRLRVGTKEDLAKMLGCSRPMLYLYESGKNEPPSGFLDNLTRLEAQAGVKQNDKELVNHSDDLRPSVINEEGEYRSGGRGRLIPLLGWAHAGDALGYEELPKDWQDELVTDCRDRKAIGVWLEGDSMEPQFHEGDALVLMPSEEAYSGCLAVCKFADDGVIFRRVEFEKDVVRLVPINVRYPIKEYTREDFVWIYPVFERRTLVWKAGR